MDLKLNAKGDILTDGKSLTTEIEPKIQREQTTAAWLLFAGCGGGNSADTKTIHNASQTLSS